MPSRRTPSGTFVQMAHSDGPYWAFVPEPLPPDVTYDGGLVAALSEADRALGELAGQARNMANPHLLIRPFIRREAQLSSQIEGTEVEIGELYAYEAGRLPLPGSEAKAAESDVREVLNYVRALEYGVGRLSGLPVSLRLIREVHERLLEGVRGEQAVPGQFRERQNWIGAPGSPVQDAVFVPPPVPEMNQALDALEKYLHAQDATPPLVRLALVHYQFEAIHPFVDGNGRIGRLLISLLSVHWGLLPHPLLYLSAYFARHRQDYVRLLRSVSDGAWREWIEFFLTGIAVEARDAVSRAKALQDLRTEWHKRVTRVRISSLLLRLVDHLFDVPILTIPQAAQVLDVSYSAAQRHVQKLVDEGVLQQAGDASYRKAYVAVEVLEAVASPGK